MFRSVLSHYYAYGHAFRACWRLLLYPIIPLALYWVYLTDRAFVACYGFCGTKYHYRLFFCDLIATVQPSHPAR
jgi:hypothetical protein